MIADIALWTLVVVGAAVTLLAIVGMYMWAVDLFLEWRHEPHQRSFYEGRQSIRDALRNDSWWFTESPETCGLLANLSRGMNVSDAREKWRKARAAFEEARVEAEAKGEL